MCTFSTIANSVSTRTGIIYPLYTVFLWADIHSCLTRRVGRRVSMPSDVNVAFEVGYPDSTDTVERWSVNCSLCGGGGENRKRFEKERASDVAPSQDRNRELFL